MPVAAPALVEVNRVRVGSGPHRHIGYVAEANRVWVCDGGASSITVLDASSGERLGAFEVGGRPQHFAFDAGCRVGYVALADDAVAVVDPLAGRLLERIPLPAGSRPSCLMPAFDRGRVYVLNHGADTVSAVDTRRNALATSIPVGRRPTWGQPWGSSYKPITQPVGKSYTSNAGSDDVTVFDDATDTVLSRIPVGRRPIRNAIYRERNAIYTANAADGTLSAIDIATDRVVATIPVGVDPFRMIPLQTVTGRDELWVLNRGSAAQPAGVVSIVSGAEQRVVRTLDVVDRPANWVINPAGSLFIVSATTRSLCVVDPRAGAISGTAALSADPHPDAHSGLIFTRAGLLCVLNSDDTVSVFRQAT